MREKKWRARTETRRKTLLAGVALLCGCADLAPEADRMPTELEVAPDRDALRSGEQIKLRVRVKDRDGAFMRIPSWVKPVWTVSDESVARSSQDGTLTGIGTGRVVVTARLGGMTADGCFHVDVPGLHLSAPVIYLTQAAQDRDNTTPLVAGRPALLRVFVVGDRAGFPAPSIQVTLLQDGNVVLEKLIPPSIEEIPTGLDESDMSASFNVELPGSVIQPGVGMVVHLDPECIVPVVNGHELRYPAKGVMALNVVEPPPLRMILVPTIASLAPDSSVFEWTDGVTADSEQMRLTRTLLPVGDMEVEVHETYTTSADLGTRAGWQDWLGEIGVLYENEGRRGYYYGVVSRSPRNALGGLANLAYPVSVGVDRDFIHTHEVGHTMGLRHAPCGFAIPTADPDYPYRGGSIGVWGYDLAMGRLLSPLVYRDVMGYCSNRWISDYHFNRALTHRFAGDGGVAHSGNAAAIGDPDPGQVLAVWGGAGDGRLKLDPAFVVDGPVVLPEQDGPYRVEGLGAGGEVWFSLSFAPTPVASGGGSFVFFVPYEPGWGDNLDRIVLTGPEGEYPMARGSEPLMAVVTDRSTGRIQAIIRNWDGGPLPGEDSSHVTVTRGIAMGDLR